MAGRDWWTTGLPGSDALVREGDLNRARPTLVLFKLASLSVK
jgi:hypothetical protein